MNSKIYIDKSMLIENTNSEIYTEQKYICVSRPRRFGKSMAANMLTAYYSRGCDSRELFSNLKISKSESYEKHMNKYNVIHINMVDFLSDKPNMDEMISEIQKSILFDLTDEFSDVRFYDSTKLVRSLKDIFAKYAVPFIFIIDEWDCIFRIHKNNTEAQTKYLDFLRNLLKDQSYVALAYMTGILPIKKYGEHSALNIFTEVSMTDPREYAEFTGFTEAEVKDLCIKYNMPFDETKKWYNGYNLMGISIYNPRSVVMSMTGGYFNNYWTSTETYEALRVYIAMNFDGLKDKVTHLVAGEEIEINTTKFQNDMTTFNSADDILTLLIHLGYLTFDFFTKKVRIPNSEVAQEFINSIEDGGWENVMKSIRQSKDLLDATLDADAEKVAEIIEQAHSDNTSILKYNDENSLACVISIAYYSARKNYVVQREMPAGKGFADIVLIPRKNVDSPAVIIELKYDKSAKSAIEQIKEKRYSDCLKDYTGEILLVGINYDKDDKSKKHSCIIEKVSKN
ncbi:MAG: AAA family ATPase [Hominimerdicola sp.]